MSGVHLNEIWWKHLADEVHQGVWCCHIPALHLRVPLQTNVKTYFITASNKRSQKKQDTLDCFLVLIRLTFWTFPIQISIWDLSLRCLAKEKFQNFPLFCCLLKILLLQWTQLYRETQNWLQAFPLALLLFCYVYCPLSGNILDSLKPSTCSSLSSSSSPHENIHCTVWSHRLSPLCRLRQTSVSDLSNCKGQLRATKTCSTWKQ